MRVRTIVLSLLLLAFCGGVAEARDSDLPKPDPKGVWRYVWDGHSTSTCVGNPKTPVCAIETIIVCHYRADAKLCSTSDYPPAGEARISARPMLVPMNLTVHLRYRIDGSVRLRKKNIIPPKEDGRQKAHPGDIVVKVVDKECWNMDKLDERCRHYGAAGIEVWIVRPFGKRWAVISGEPVGNKTVPYLDLLH